MAKKKTAIVAAVFWAMFGLSFAFNDPYYGLWGPGAPLFCIGILGGIGALIALAVMGIIDYARRPR